MSVYDKTHYNKKKKDRNNNKKILFMKELEEQSKLICMQGLVRYGRIW